jgi:hypothetical protein
MDLADKYECYRCIEHTIDDTAIQREVNNTRDRCYTLLKWLCSFCFIFTLVVLIGVLLADNPNLKQLFLAGSIVASLGFYFFLGLVWWDFIKPDSQLLVICKKSSRDKLEYMQEEEKCMHQKKLKCIKKKLNFLDRVFKEGGVANPKKRGVFNPKDRIMGNYFFIAVSFSWFFALCALIVWLPQLKVPYSISIPNVIHYLPRFLYSISIPNVIHYLPPFLFFISISNIILYLPPFLFFISISNIILYVALIVAIFLGCFILHYTYKTLKKELGFFLEKLGWFLAIPMVISLFVLLGQVYLKAPYWWHDLVEWYATPATAVEHYVLIVSRVAFLGITIFFLFVIYRLFRDFNDFYSVVHTKELGKAGISQAVLLLPKRVRKKDSRGIFLAVYIKQKKAESEHIEAQLQCKGLTFDGPQQVKIKKKKQPPTAVWNGSFDDAGIHTINIALTNVKPLKLDSHTFFTQKHRVEVHNFFTASWMPILAAVIPLLTAVIAALSR